MILNFKEYKPFLDEGVFLAPGSVVVGRCRLGRSSSIWYNAVLRGDVNEIVIGEESNVQDGSVIHCDRKYPTTIGNRVTVGHNAIIHGCSIGDNCIIGMGSTILDEASIGNNVIIGANSLVTSGKSIPDGVLAMGAPAKVIRNLTEEEISAIARTAAGYVELSGIHKGNAI